jgi:hypothetical protein
MAKDNRLKKAKNMKRVLEVNNFFGRGSPRDRKSVPSSVRKQQSIPRK